MPTGYTADLYDGKDVSFNQFAMSCARAFGACILMRDDPADVEIPQEFKPDTDYHDNALIGAKAELLVLEEMSEKEKVSGCDTFNIAAQHDYIRRAKEELEIRERYQNMLNQVRAWVPPTPDHKKFKEFMIEQLVNSIEHDCSYYSTKSAPINISIDEWYNAKLESAKWSVQYHTEAREKEIERAKSRTEWIQNLRKSLV